MLMKVPSIDVQQAKVQTIDIGQIAIGPIVVDDLVLNNTSFSMTGAQGQLSNVTVTITINIAIVWHVHVGMPWPFNDIDFGDTYNFSLVFGPLSIGNVAIPALNNLNLNIPTVTAQNMSVAANPTALQLHNVNADQVQTMNITLPSGGFALAGLTLASVQGNGIGVPTATLDQATVAHAYGDAVTIPSFTLNNLNLPAMQIPSVSSATPVDIPANLPTQSRGFNAGILSLAIHITPSAQMHIGQLTITNASAAASVGQVVLHNVTLPYDALNLTLSQIGISGISIPSFNIA